MKPVRRVFSVETGIKNLRFIHVILYNVYYISKYKAFLKAIAIERIKEYHSKFPSVVFL